MRTWLKNQRGDTIVEVLIALVVVSSIMTGAYLSSNQSLNNNRQSQERGEALKYAEEQLERLKAVSGTSPASVFSAANVFCLDGANAVKDATTPTYPSNNGLPSVATDPLNYSPSCTSGRFFAAIEHDTSANVFRVHVRWSKLGSTGGAEEVKITYRVVQ